MAAIGKNGTLWPRPIRIGSIRQKRRPCFAFMVVGKRCVGRAGRRQDGLHYGGRHAVRIDEFLKRLRSFFAVEINMGDARMRGEESRKIIGDFACNGGVQTARAHAGLQNVPQRNFAISQKRKKLAVGKRPVFYGEQIFDEGPEKIARMRVILPRFE